MPTRHAVIRAGTELVYWTWPGAGSPTLLLHGIGNYGRYWDLFADAVDGRLQLIAPDARGHGESGRPAEGYAPVDFAGDAVAVLDQAGIQSALVVGHSMGGLHSIGLAARHPSRVRALVIVDASPEPLREGAERAQRLLTGRPSRFRDRAEARAYLEKTSPGYAAAVYENRLGFAFREDEGGLVWRSDAAALGRIMSGRVPREDRWRALASIECPTLVVRGSRSNVLSEAAAHRMVETLRSGSLLTLEAGHNVPLDRPRELADAVVRSSEGSSGTGRTTSSRAD